MRIQDERVRVHAATHSQPVTPADIDTASFRQGSFDLSSNRRPVDP
jgi:hypothetical protein